MSRLIYKKNSLEVIYITYYYNPPSPTSHQTPEKLHHNIYVWGYCNRDWVKEDYNRNKQIVFSKITPPNKR